MNEELTGRVGCVKTHKIGDDLVQNFALCDEYFKFVSLVKRMREAQDAFNISVSADNIEDIDFWHIRMLELEREVDEYLKKME
jgi:hypothetical protein